MTYLQGNVKQLEGRINNQILGVKGLNPKSDQRFTSLYSSTAGSFIKIMRILPEGNNCQPKKF